MIVSEATISIPLPEPATAWATPTVPRVGATPLPAEASELIVQLNR